MNAITSDKRYHLRQIVEMRGYDEKTLVTIIGYHHGNRVHGEYLVKFPSGSIGNAREEELFPV